MADSVIITHLQKCFIQASCCGWRSFRRSVEKKAIACQDVNLTLRRGELMGLAGPNGSGKSTLMRIIAGVILPDGGQVLVEGHDVATQAPYARRHIGFMTSENRNFYVRLTARENLRFFCCLSGVPSATIDKNMTAVVDLLELAPYMDTMFQQNSTGIRQRIALARSLLQDAPVLLLDEPTKHLDAHVTQKILRYVKDVLVRGQGRTVLMASHSLGEIGHVADRVALIRAGQLRAVGTLDELRQSTGKAVADLTEIYTFCMTGR